MITSCTESENLEKSASAPPPTPHTMRLLYLDGWRGASILIVLLGHFMPIPGINTARFGVECFFVLSGRLMADVLFVERVPLGFFFKRRIARVWPALFTFVLVMLVVFLAPGPLHVRPIAALLAVTFTINYVPGVSQVLDHVWSLCIEEWGYLVLGLVAFLSRSLNISGSRMVFSIAIICIVNGVIQTMAGGSYYNVYWRTDVRIASILLASALFLKLRTLAAIPAWVPIFAGGVAILLNTEGIPNPIKYTAGTLALSVAIGTIDRTYGWLLKFLSHPLIVRAGLMSFSLYLWQQPLYKLSGRGVPRPLLLCAAIVVGAAGFYLIERPARRFLNARWGNQPA